MEPFSLCHPFSFLSVVRYTRSGQRTAEMKQCPHFYLPGVHFSFSSLLTILFPVPFSPLLINTLSQKRNNKKKSNPLFLF